MGREELHSFAALSSVDAIITDTEISPGTHAELSGCGIDIICAGATA